jgi:hypothetical protein
VLNHLAVASVDLIDFCHVEVAIFRDGNDELVPNCTMRVHILDAKLCETVLGGVVLREECLQKAEHASRIFR